MEADHSKTQILHNKAGAPSAATKEIYKEIKIWFSEIVQSAAAGLTALYQKNGLELVTEDVFATDRLENERTYHSTMFTRTAGGLMGTLLVKAGKKTQEEVDDLILKAVEETKSGNIYQHSELYAVIGRRASDQRKADTAVQSTTAY